MWFSVLGPLEVRNDDGAQVPLGGAQQRSVLALLLLNPSRTVPGGRLISEIWGESPPDRAYAGLAVHVCVEPEATGRT